MTSTAWDLDRFVSATSERGDGSARFDNESARTLRIDVDGGVWLKPGAAIAYRGALTFERLPTLDASSLNDAMMREAAPLVRAAGKGRLYCASHAAYAHVVRLEGQAIVVAWQDLLAFEESLTFAMSLVGHGVGVAAGGLVSVQLSGHGSFAMGTHGEPLTLNVTPDNPISTDPHATLAWSADLSPALKTDLSWRSMIAHGGHEPLQMYFSGAGFVVVQPFEDPSGLSLHGNPIKQIKKLVRV
jgi:uncharacterized protein (AIM24 family)